MRIRITHLFEYGPHADTAAPVPILTECIPPLLQPFKKQSVSIRSIAAIGCHQVLGIDGSSGSPVAVDPCVGAAVIHLLDDRASRVTTPDATQAIGSSEYTLDEFAQHLARSSPASSGEDLLLASVDLLNEMMAQSPGDLGFRAVAAIVGESCDIDDLCRLRRDLFDRGLLCSGSITIAARKALCFIDGDSVQSMNALGGESRGYVTMSGLIEGGRFANRMFRYAYVKLYALRHGLTAAFPPWEGNHLFGLKDRLCAGIDLPRLSFRGCTDDDLELWRRPDPPINIDLAGYFQELPECWRKYRPFLRRMFQLPDEQRHAIAAWHDSITAAGRRSLVAIHVRRGDYRQMQREETPWFRIVPEEWYLDWLRNIWPTLREPLLFVATDEPDTVLPVFREFAPVPTTFESRLQALPDHIRDFEILRRADALAICNSSFSRMAAILAPPTQKCFLPSFRTRSFEPYEPWMDPAFWARFVDAFDITDLPGDHRNFIAATGDTAGAPAANPDARSIYFDISDLLLYLRDHATVSGIQRVQCEILRNLPADSPSQPVRFVVMNQRSQLGAIDKTALLRMLERVQSGAVPREDIKAELCSILTHVSACPARPGDIFLTIGAFWNVAGAGRLLQQLNDSGVAVGVFIHDILPISAPEYFESRDARTFLKGVTAALTFADLVITTSLYNKTQLLHHMSSRQLNSLPVQVVPLAHGLPHSASSNPVISTEVAALSDREYVLCVGTIEVRKNPIYLFNIWKMLVRSGRTNVPNLVFVGRKGWLVQDFIGQLESCGYLGGKVVILHNVNDAELELLYRKCILTMFPSFVEGWGLPAAESLAHGKICICSSEGGIPEIGGDLLDYTNPYNVLDGLNLLQRYLDNPELRRNREQQIAGQFKPRSWRSVAGDVLRSVLERADDAGSRAAPGAITLPPETYVPLTADAASGGVDASLSPELICVSGWQAPGREGVQAQRSAAIIRFRPDAPAGAKINVVLRLAALGRDARIRLTSGSGAQTEAPLGAGRENLATLPCEVEPEKLVTVQLCSVATPPDEPPANWLLKGVLYFDPKQVAAAKQLAAAASTPPPVAPQQPQVSELAEDAILLQPRSMDDSHPSPSLDAFLQGADCYWRLDCESDRRPPIFANDADRRAFYSGCGDSANAPQIGKIGDSVRLLRRSDQFVSLARFSEGSVFDRSGIRRGFGFLHSSPPGMASWASNRDAAVEVEEQALASALRRECSCFVFYNGNLHNYYHWLVEGLLCLDVLSRALGPASDVEILLPSSMHINAVFNHRETLRAVGIAGHEPVEVAADLIHVREAIWVDSDLVQSMPATFLRNFQQRVSALYAGSRTPGKRRLLVARQGPTRTIQNIDKVESFVSKHGFDTVYLEGMSMADQILLFQSAEFVISPHGAGLANLLFCDPGTKVIELMPSVEMRPFFWVMSEKLGLVHGLQFCDPAGEQRFQSAITVDLRKLETLMRMVDTHP